MLLNWVTRMMAISASAISMARLKNSAASSWSRLPPLKATDTVGSISNAIIRALISATVSFTR